MKIIKTASKSQIKISKSEDINPVSEHNEHNEHNEHIECRSEEGITIGLIDSLIYICRVLVKRDMTLPKVIEALKDIQDDDDCAKILNADTTGK